MTDIDENQMKEMYLIDEKGGGSPILATVYTIGGKKKGVKRLETVLFHQ